MPFARATFEAYWGFDQDVSQDAVLSEICAKVGIEPSEFFAGIARPEIKDELKANTTELMERVRTENPGQEVQDLRRALH